MSTSDDVADSHRSGGGSASSASWSLVSVLVPLLLVYVSNQWSRSSLYYLVNFSDSPSVSAYTAMNVDLNFSEAQYGALASVAFTVLFAVASLVAGNLSDKSDRKILTIRSTSAWSVATLATAIAANYGQVLAARVFMGLACAFTTPAAYTLIRDLVPKDMTALANSVYGGGVYLGGALSSLSILLDEKLGWRGALGAIGAYGLACTALVAAVLPDDPMVLQRRKEGEVGKKGDEEMKKGDDKDGSPSAPSSSLLTDASRVLSASPAVRYLYLGSFLRFSSGLCIGVWAAPYYRLAFPEDASSYAVVNALIVGLCGVASGVAGGFLSDRTGAAATKAGIDEGAGRLAVPVVGTILAAPAWYLSINVSTFRGAMGWLAVEYLLAECWFGPVVAVLQSKVGPKLGGTAQGIFTLAGAVGNLAPSVVGVLYGRVNTAAGGSESRVALSGILAVAVCAGYILSAVCFALCARAAVADVDINKSTTSKMGKQATKAD